MPFPVIIVIKLFLTALFFVTMVLMDSLTFLWVHVINNVVKESFETFKPLLLACAKFKFAPEPGITTEMALFFAIALCLADANIKQSNRFNGFEGELLILYFKDVSSGVKHILEVPLISRTSFEWIDQLSSYIACLTRNLPKWSLLLFSFNEILPLTWWQVEVIWHLGLHDSYVKDLFTNF